MSAMNVIDGQDQCVPRAISPIVSNDVETSVATCEVLV